MAARSRGQLARRIGDALLFRQFECRFLHEDHLALVALAGAAPLHDHRSELRVLGRPACQGRVASVQIHKVADVRAVEAAGDAIG